MFSLLGTLPEKMECSVRPVKLCVRWSTSSKDNINDMADHEVGTMLLILR